MGFSPKSTLDRWSSIVYYQHLIGVDRAKHFKDAATLDIYLRSNVEAVISPSSKKKSFK